MKFIDWYNFNFVDNKIMNINEVYVIVLRKLSYKKEDIIFEAKIKIQDVVNIFAEYNLMQIRAIHNYPFIEILIYNEEQTKSI